MLGEILNGSVGNVTVNTTSNMGLTPEELTEMAIANIIYVGKDAPKPLQDQAMAYQNRLKQVILHYLKQAVKSDRTTLVNKLNNAGHTDAAKIIRRL